MQAAITTEAKVGAYYRGRNSVWMERGPKCPEIDPVLAGEWKAGRRDALAEERLDADTEWNEDFPTSG